MVDAAAPRAEISDELLQRTIRLWFRSPGIALGLLPDDAYWKWNRTEGRLRIAPMREDRKLDLEGLFSRERGDLEILAYKPESRIAWTGCDDAGRKFYKHYKRSRFDAASAHAKLFRQAYADRGMTLLGSDPQSRLLIWEWIEGRPPEPREAAGETARDFILNHFQANNLQPPASAVAAFGAHEIREHVEARFEAHRAWIPRLRPESAEIFRELEARWTELRPGLESPASGVATQIVHGDLRRRNIRVAPSGAWRLCDADHLASGEPEWDIAGWTADLALDDPDIAELAFYGDRPELRADRLYLYHEVWRLLFGLRDIEERRA